MISDPPTVLLVEDEDRTRKAYAHLLSEPYDVAAASTGQAAVERFDADIDIVLLDRGLSEMRGRDVLRELQARNQDCYVAMVTGKEPDFDIIEFGIDDYLIKPVTAAEIEQTVERLRLLAEYDETYRELSQKRVKRNILSQEKSADELDDNPDFARLAAEIETLEAELDDIADEVGTIERDIEP